MDEPFERESRASQPDPVDIHVGSRVRLRRTTLGMSQEQLGEALGLTFQQVQKYERGTNRVSASRLFHIAERLDVEVDYFYEGLAGRKDANTKAALRHGMSQGQETFQDESILYKRETLELVRAYSRITNPASRKVVYDLIKSLAPESP